MEQIPANVAGVGHPPDGIVTLLLKISSSAKIITHEYFKVRSLINTINWQSRFRIMNNQGPLRLNGDKPGIFIMPSSLFPKIIWINCHMLLYMQPIMWIRIRPKMNIFIFTGSKYLSRPGHTGNGPQSSVPIIRPIVVKYMNQIKSSIVRCFTDLK